MSTKLKNPRFVVIVVASLAALGTGVGLAIALPGTRQPETIGALPPTVIRAVDGAGAGTSIVVAPLVIARTASVTAAKALATALRNTGSGGSSVLGEELMLLRTDPDAQNKLVWVIAFVPHAVACNGPIGACTGPLPKYNFDVAFVDARSGAWISELAGHSYSTVSLPVATHNPWLRNPEHASACEQEHGSASTDST